MSDDAEMYASVMYHLERYITIHNPLNLYLVQNDRHSIINHFKNSSKSTTRLQFLINLDGDILAIFSKTIFNNKFGTIQLKISW